MTNTTGETLTLFAPDISCAHCVAAIQEAVGPLDGVSRVEPNAGTKQVLVEFDPNRLTLGRLEAAMDDAGYPVQK